MIPQEFAQLGAAYAIPREVKETWQFTSLGNAGGCVAARDSQDGILHHGVAQALIARKIPRPGIRSRHFAETLRMPTASQESSGTCESGSPIGH